MQDGYATRVCGTCVSVSLFLFLFLCELCIIYGTVPVMLCFSSQIFVFRSRYFDRVRCKESRKKVKIKKKHENNALVSHLINA